MVPIATSANQQHSYRSVKPLPAQLLDHCTFSFEEELYSQVFPLLFSTLTAGIDSDRPCHVPPPQHLGLAATWIVHPQLTTRTTSQDKHVAADGALRYLRHINRLAGSRNAGLDKAFTFTENLGSSRTKRVRIRQSEHKDVDESEDQPGRIRSQYIGKESLWSQGEDFWSVLGWALNCSIANKQRWERWKLWLELMLDVLEDDLASSGNAGDDGASGEDSHGECMLACYLRPIGDGRNNKRRLMRAIFADGGQKSLAEFGEVWKNETKAPRKKKDERASKRRKLDLESGKYGDYFGDDSDAESPQSAMRRSRSATAKPSRQASDAEDASDEDDDSPERSPENATSLSGIDAFGGTDSIHIRQRLLALIYHFCSLHPKSFLSPEDLLDLYTEFLRPLPLPVFQQFVLPSKPYLAPQEQSQLNQFLLRPLLGATAPPFTEEPLTAEKVERCYAPFTANGIGAVDNAKCSLLIEGLLRELWRNGGLAGRANKGLKERVEEGVEARKTKVAPDGRRRTGRRAKDDEEAVAAMEASAERMAVCFELV